MWFNRYDGDEDAANQARIERLESYHRGRHGLLLGVLSLAVVAFIAWAMVFRIDEVARATGEVIASSRVQIIQSVDGGVLSQLRVREGDRVEPGQILARLDQTRIGATVGEVEARLFALKAKAVRLRAEVSGAGQLVFPKDVNPLFQEQINVERALFRQRGIGLQEELRTLRVAVDLARKQLRLVEQLLESGDVSGSELLRAQRDANEAEARLVNRKNKFLEDARIELTKAEDEIAQAEQMLTRRQQERQDSVFTAQVKGIVKNIRVTTVGGVLRAGEEIMQIVPVDDELIIEAKVRPADIAQIQPGLQSNIRFDPFDYTIFGSVPGKVIYVSADTLKEDTQRGEEIYYRVHVSPTTHPATSTTGKTLDILPGMTAQVDIRTGDRTLMDYLLKPLKKTVSEAFGER
ncbi:HlyD family efflux transporter periplasmic adaptor subunit [Pseudomonas benzenivorans]|uniref:HlyD family efflux transporter periplasmic adaptor subunit n=1 Tax=Pseudomonas benzenivorans TaxID=556533 RepID=A0ABY5H601_9PSED|nr:HlyD family efflux transporter periplasmic adaptor subunit [Pseudomonas benzenivorans]UTW07211.1 HlyD family efflux transporter periplasmic adaptor subunit [Pseudomonas benzenivorans]